MKKDHKWNVSLATEHPSMTEEANLKTSYCPGKKGGNFALSLGAKISIPDGLFGKHHHITCEVAPPSARWRHVPVLRASEHLVSEIFILSSAVHPLRKAVIVQLPYYSVDLEHNELNVKGRWTDESEWVDVGFLKKEDSTMPAVELEITRLGVFLVTFTPKREMFPVTQQGCMYNARCNRHITVRFPKRSIETSMHCSIQIVPIMEEKLDLTIANYPVQCGELLAATEFIDINPTVQCTFRRPVTVKLPLPKDVVLEKDNGADIAVVAKHGDSWVLVESNLKFSKATVQFDVKVLSRFCVCRAKPDRRAKMKDAIQVLEDKINKERGEVALFLSLRDKSWMVVIECFPENKSEVRCGSRSTVGFRYVKKYDAPPPVEKFTSRRRPATAATAVKAHSPKQPDIFEIQDGCKWEIEVLNDVKVRADSDYAENRHLQFFQSLPESYRRFVIEPKTNTERTLCCIVNVVPVGVSEQAKERMTLTFRFDIEEERVKAYFKPEEQEPEPEPKPAPIKMLFEPPPLETINEVSSVVPIKSRTFSSTALERLTRPIRPIKIPEKESRVLTGKSLMNLARFIPEGLTLAVHLDLPDSTITGLGFDAISNGLGMADVTYKILLYWKRRLKDKRNGAVKQLTSSLMSMGRSDVADIVQEMHDANKELGPSCFQYIM